MAFATLVLAGMQDGSGMTTQAAHNIQGSSVITKHAGGAFGAIATANVAVRNGLLHFVLGPHVCPDPHVRGLDASAAIPRTELCSVNEISDGCLPPWICPHCLSLSCPCFLRLTFAQHQRWDLPTFWPLAYQGLGSC